MNSKSSFLIGSKEVGEGCPVYFIADIAANHDGDIERAKDLIYRAADAGADAAKFQHFTAESIVSDLGFKALGRSRSHQADWKKTVFEIYKDASVKIEWSSILKDTCDKAGITFFTSPYSFDLVDSISDFVPAFKIGSGDITWIELIEYIAAKEKPYIIASGASSFEDVIRATQAGLSINSKMCLMQCNTNYTGSIENFHYIQLNVLKTFQNMFPGLVLGLSDHTPGHSTVLGAIALGAKMIEKHFTDDTSREGPDHKFSMDPASWKEMVDRSRELEAALGNGVKRVEKNELETAILQRRSIRLATDLNADSIIDSSCIEMLRPCPDDALPPYLVQKVLGKTIRSDKSKGDYLKWTDLK